jgi:hypothetical protein
MRDAQSAGKYDASRLLPNKIVIEYAKTDGFVDVTPKTIVEMRRNEKIAQGIPKPTPIKTGRIASRRTAPRMTRG